jgi:hypothetical protein
MQPACVTRMGQSVANVQRVVQGPAYQEKERRAATWNAAGCGSGLSESDDMELVRSKSRPCGRKRKVTVSRTRSENGASEQVPGDGGGKRGGRGFARKRKDSAEGAVVVVVNAHPPRTPHDHIDRINRPFADEQNE